MNLKYDLSFQPLSGEAAILLQHGSSADEAHSPYPLGKTSPVLPSCQWEDDEDDFEDEDEDIDLEEDDLEEEWEEEEFDIDEEDFELVEEDEEGIDFDPYEDDEDDFYDDEPEDLGGHQVEDIMPSPCKPAYYMVEARMKLL